jgi:hypothetical protein
MWKRSHGEAGETPATERAGTRYAEANTAAPHLDSTCPAPGRRAEARGNTSPIHWFIFRGMAKCISRTAEARLATGSSKAVAGSRV